MNQHMRSALPWCVLLFLSLRGVAAYGQAADRGDYAGDAACLKCHREVSASYMHTAHHATSQLPSRGSVLGLLRESSARLTINDPAAGSPEPLLYFTMEARPDGFYESAWTGFGASLMSRTERIGVVTGSGRRGQTYLYWQGDRLFELPVSFWTGQRRWINSPGFIDGTAEFSRPIQPGCLECHASYIRPLSPLATTNRYAPGSLETGIACETCHGPGKAHAEMEGHRTAGSAKPAGTAILNPAAFPRDRQIDLCALCHNGIARKAMRPAFSYLPGRPLSEYYQPLPGVEVDVERPDVHGNQVGLLERSRCFRESATMTCSTCHNVHASGAAAESYSARCLTCHQVASCPVAKAKSQAHAAAANCIGCHMPVQSTSAIVSETAGAEVRATMRTHWIKIYPEAAPK